MALIDPCDDGSSRLESRRMPPGTMACKALAVRLRKTCSKAGGAIATGGKSESRSSSTRTSLDSAGPLARRAASARTAFKSPGARSCAVGARKLK